MSLDYLARNDIPILNMDGIMDSKKCSPFFLPSGHVVYVNYELKVKKKRCQDYDVHVNPCDNECCVLTMMKESNYVKLVNISRKCTAIYVDIRNLNRSCCLRKETMKDRLTMIKDEFHAHGIIQFFSDNQNGYYTISGNSDFIHVFVNTIYIFKDAKDGSEDGLQFEIAQRCKILFSKDFIRMCKFVFQKYYYLKSVLWSRCIRYINDINISQLLTQAREREREQQHALYQR